MLNINFNIILPYRYSTYFHYRRKMPRPPHHPNNVWCRVGVTKLPTGEKCLYILGSMLMSWECATSTADPWSNHQIGRSACGGIGLLTWQLCSIISVATLLPLQQHHHHLILMFCTNFRPPFCSYFFPPWHYTTHSGCVFYSPLSGFILLTYEVTWSHTATRHSR